MRVVGKWVGRESKGHQSFLSLYFVFRLYFFQGGRLPLVSFGAIISPLRFKTHSLEDILIKSDYHCKIFRISFFPPTATD